MMPGTFGYRTASRVALAALFFTAGSLASPSADAIATSPFDALIGRWTGDGILGFKESKPERVKCRATYLLDPAAQNELKQTIRCATSSGAVEVISNLKEDAGKLTGHWKETIHNFEGDLTGEVTPKGFRIIVKGADITANMDIIVRGTMQAVEIQFVNSSLVGLSMAMKKG
ncbi:conserved hypothetical protein [Hyphomicrobium denitrificans ATCC 51888]|uniref:Uncharacterized protein n=1 Tax=Hyphomicrobium denitrificans (strain ATCC 51888 / DSM 1869 / NCIMB 11706 / TK 0415) TaxID=582899 RepID=D8JWQ4_HYPDA|nr:hypothetical protein [Hyphomicrobium denitrificans]ADJ25012.1 conserved hypothetical protein [Hyphomicrobium denitrificans ATCC 51888]